MIRILGRQNPTDHFVSIDPADIQGVEAYDLIWADVGGADTEKAAEIYSTLGLDRDIAPGDDYFKVASPKSHSVPFTIQVPQISDKGLVTDRIDVVIGRHAVVTEHDDPVRAIDRLDPAVLDIQDIATPAGLAASLTQSAGREMIPLIEELEVRIDGLEDLAFAADPRALTEVHVLRRDLITLRRIAGRQRDVLKDLSDSVHHAIGADGREAFSLAADQAVRLVESLESGRSLLGSALETYRGAVADQTNEIVRLLTVFSSIMLPLTLITGIFGMNFVDIPTLKDSSGFWIWIGVMVAIAISLWVFFVKRGFIGRPRLREIPKSVGLGIVSVGTAPVRAIASGVGSTVKYLDPRKKPEAD